MTKKYTWLYEVHVPNIHTTQFDCYADFKEYINHFQESGYAVYIEHATQKDPMTRAYIYRQLLGETEVTQTI